MACSTKFHSPSTVECTDISDITNQLKVARNEINNLRQLIRSIQSNHTKDLDKIKNLLKSWRCEGCCSKDVTDIPRSCEETLKLNPIGTISSWFPEKRGTPRQPNVSISSHGKLTLFNSVFTNPEHSLDGLEEFSHMWILFYFHKIDSTHIRAKVSPPRLNGIRKGVFGTRSPNRPSPIGLSLVSIDKVEGSSIYFSGVDMVDGTPVIDIKPYIPQYDSPLEYNISSSHETGTSRFVDGSDLDAASSVNTVKSNLSAPVVNTSKSAEGSPLHLEGKVGEREAPDGEEGESSLPPSVSSNNATSVPLLPLHVKVPPWVSNPPVSKLTVKYTDRAKAQLDEVIKLLNIDEDPDVSITNVLQEDPRSVYLRQRWGNQFYTFLICNLHVSCKFDDQEHTVTVFQIKSAGKLCECGHLEWQCSIHGEIAG